ncbi:hypothetical protein CDD83_10283 [Cordyceps sp. RAO-2017]|nr:hypothetical protein CDD83_10283 [Cordyceps sp. RAO-2017]
MYCAVPASTLDLTLTWSIASAISIANGQRQRTIRGFTRDERLDPRTPSPRPACEEEAQRRRAAKDLWAWPCCVARYVSRYASTICFNIPSTLTGMPLPWNVRVNLSLLPSGDEWAAPAARHYGDSLRMLVGHLGSGEAGEDALTSTMLLCSYKTIAARGPEHQRHCDGAMVLISTAESAQRRTAWIGRANFSIYVRHEITVALVKETPLQISPKEWNVDWRGGEVDEDALANRQSWLLTRAAD